MIGRCTRAVDFKAVLGAVLNKPGAEVLFDNYMCGIHDVQGTSNLMLTEASVSRTKQPVYHLSVRWDKHDGATRAQMEETAQRLLGKLKLQEHQALCVRHTDAEHPHIHVIVNRVHPDHGTMGPNGKKIYVWSGWKDYERVERELRKLEVEHGCARCQVDTRPDEHLGCRRLRYRCQEIPTLKGVFFGHIHSSHGHARMQGVDYFNCSILNEAYNVAYGPIMTDINTT